jgi:hypothetical protein
MFKAIKVHQNWIWPMLDDDDYDDKDLPLEKVNFLYKN